jgi:endogenous inhibitor of DNA gyrase (YacG/DUF329 family)
VARARALEGEGNLAAHPIVRAMDCPQCGNRVPAGRHGQRRIYCSPACRKAAELDARAERKVAAFQASVADVATSRDLLLWLTAAARRGSVAACRILLEELRRDRAGETVISGSIIDELAAKRNKAVETSGNYPFPGGTAKNGAV